MALAFSTGQAKCCPYIVRLHICADDSQRSEFAEKIDVCMHNMPFVDGLMLFREHIALFKKTHSTRRKIRFARWAQRSDLGVNGNILKSY